MPISKFWDIYLGSRIHQACPICDSDATRTVCRVIGNPRFYPPQESWSCGHCGVSWLIEDFLNDAPITFLSFADFKLGLEALPQFDRFPNLKQLDLSWTQTNDFSIGTWTIPITLEHLDLGGTQITDASMPTIGALTNITSLDLSQTNVTDAGMYELRNLRNLHWVSILGTSVSPAGREMLRRSFPRVRFGPAR